MTDPNSRTDAIPRTEPVSPPRTVDQQTFANPPTLRRILSAIWPVLVFAGSLLSLLAVTYGPLTSGDETAHVDYTWQVWNGSLPDFYEGLRFNPGFGQWPPVQWEAQHPPLFYLLTAPILGPLIDAGHPLRAVLAGRFISVGITLITLTALAWAVTRIVGGRRPLTWAVVTTTFAAVISPVLRTGSTFYNDMLGIAATAVALGVLASALRWALTGRLVAVAAACTAVAIGVRANSVLILAVVAGGLAVACWRSTPQRGVRRWGTAIVVGLVPVVVAAATFGWYYVRNVQITGTWTGSYMPWFIENMNRRIGSYSAILPRFKSWIANPFFIHQRGHPVYVPFNDWSQRVAQILLVTGLIAGIALGQRRLRFQDWSRRWIELLVLGVCAAQLIGTIAMFVVYVRGGGGYNARYFLPALVPFTLIFAAGVMCFPRLWRPVMLGVAILACVPAFVQWLYRVQRGNGWGLGETTKAGVPMFAIWGMLMIAVVAFAIILWRLPMVESGKVWRGTGGGDPGAEMAAQSDENTVPVTSNDPSPEPGPDSRSPGVP